MGFHHSTHKAGEKSTQITSNDRVGIKLAGHLVIMVHDILAFIGQNATSLGCQARGDESIHRKQAKTLGLYVANEDGIAIDQNRLAKVNGLRRALPKPSYKLG